MALTERMKHAQGLCERLCAARTSWYTVMELMFLMELQKNIYNLSFWHGIWADESYTTLVALYNSKMVDKTEEVPR